jgi:hypothetical protein
VPNKPPGGLFVNAPTGHIKEKYNPTPTRREREYHLWLMQEHPCICGCGEPSATVHHPLTRHPAQRWRRDHEFVVPMTDHCHRALHAMGRESLFSDINFAAEAWFCRKAGLRAGQL